MANRNRWRLVLLPLLIAVLLVASAALFGMGVALEHGGGADTHTSVASTDTGGHAETGQEGGGKPTGHTDSRRQDAGAIDGASSERVLGVPLESPATVTLAVAVSLLLAGLVWRFSRPPVIVVVAVFAAGAVVFDIAEAARQFSAGRAGIGVLAIFVAALHLAVVAAATALLRRTLRPAPAPALPASA